MATDEVSIEVPAAPDEVWAVVADFGGLDKFFPGVDSVRVEGDERVLELGGRTLRERLLSSDDATRTLRYGIVDGMPGLEHHEGTVTVAPDGEGSRVTWGFIVEPDAFATRMSASYTRALAALRDHFS